MSGKIFIAGATGFVGRHLLPELLKNGYVPRVLTHRRTLSSLDGVETVNAEIESVEQLAKAMHGCDAVINLIGIIREFPRGGVTFQKLHFEATKNLVDAAEKSGIKRYIQMSALGARENAVSAYHKTKFAAEEIVCKSSLNWTIFRPSLIYGEGDAFINMLADQIRVSPIIPVIGDGKYRLQPIHADDVALCFAKSIGNNGAYYKKMEIGGDIQISYNDLIREIASALSKNNRILIHLPLAIMQFIIKIMQKIPQFPITMDQLQMLLEENITSDVTWQKIFGLTPRILKNEIRKYL